MTSTGRPQSFLTGNTSQDADRVNKLLSRLQEELGGDAALKKAVRFNIVPKGHNEAKRALNLLKYEGPDSEALTLLEQNYGAWLAKPIDFWTRPDCPDLQRLNPGAQMKEHRGLYLQPKDIAHSLRGRVSSDLKKVENAIQTMTTAGSYFKNLETVVGAGTTLLLGTNTSDDSWTRVLGKRGDKFDKVVVHLREKGIPELAARYAPLRTLAVAKQLEVFRAYVEWDKSR